MGRTVGEGDVAIVIPTYKYSHLIRDTVASALATGAGEIIVVDDASGDGTMLHLREFSDPRLVAAEQPCNVGLWQNHLHALQLTSKPWIKFLQADDRLTAGALSRMVQHIEADVSLVWSNPTFIDLTSGKQWRRYALPGVRRWSTEEVFALMLRVGLFLGTPSHMLIRRDVLDLSADAWRNDVSADFIMAMQAAAQGAVVGLPEGNVLHGVHPGQDGNTQGFRLGGRRLINTVTYLRMARWDRPIVRQFVDVFAVAALVGWLRNMAGQLRRGARLDSEMGRDLAKLAGLVSWRSVGKLLPYIGATLRRRYQKEIIDLVDIQ
jgi:glycosyltransferase involved in cell wall biosynthesis